MENADEPESGKRPEKKPPARSGSRSASSRGPAPRKPATGNKAGGIAKPAAKGKPSAARASGTPSRGGRPASAARASTASTGSTVEGTASGESAEATEPANTTETEPTETAESPETTESPETAETADSAESTEPAVASPDRVPFVVPRLTVPTISGGTARARDEPTLKAGEDVSGESGEDADAVPDADTAVADIAAETDDAEAETDVAETETAETEAETTPAESDTVDTASDPDPADAVDVDVDVDAEVGPDVDVAESAIAPPEYEPVPGADLVPAPMPSQTDAMLSVRGLTKRFDDTTAVRAIDLDVPTGSIFGIVGPNGAGKTTTLSMITGLLRPDAGTVTVHGADVWADPVAAKRQLGVLPDRLRLFDRLTGSQLLYYSAVLRGLDGAVAKQRVADLAAVFRIEDALGRLVSDYSTGMTKKVALAAAMIHAPRMLVLDEPFESVDPVSAATVTGILRDYVAAGGTVLLSSHSMALVERICDRVAVIVDGDVLAVGSIDDVRGDVSLEERFVQLAGSAAELEGVEWLHTFSD